MAERTRDYSFLGVESCKKALEVIIDLLSSFPVFLKVLATRITGTRHEWYFVISVSARVRNSMLRFALLWRMSSSLHFLAGTEASHTPNPKPGTLVATVCYFPEEL